MCDGRARLKCAGCGERVCAPCYGLPRLPRGTWYGRRRRARATDAGCQPASNWRQPCRPGDGGAPRQPRPADARPRPRRKPRRADAPHGRVARRSAAQGKAQEGESRVRVRQADLARVAGARRAVVREEIGPSRSLRQRDVRAPSEGCCACTALSACIILLLARTDLYTWFVGTILGAGVLALAL